MMKKHVGDYYCSAGKEGGSHGKAMLDGAFKRLFHYLHFFAGYGSYINNDIVLLELNQFFYHQRVKL